WSPRATPSARAKAPMSTTSSAMPARVAVRARTPAATWPMWIATAAAAPPARASRAAVPRAKAWAEPGAMAADITTARERMVEVHLAGRGIRDPRVLAAMRTVPRERFVGADMEDLAYEDSPLPIGAGQTISQPYI